MQIGTLQAARILLTGVTIWLRGKAAPMRERAVLYARISLDKTGDQVGVTRQLHDMRQLAETRGYDVVAEVTEDAISASKGLRRPGYEQVWKLVRSAGVDHVIVWQSSRLMRSRKDRAEVINTFGKHNVDVIAVKGPSFDLRSAYGRGMADMVTSFDTMEGEVKAERVSAAIADLARRGKAWGHCPYGWDRAGSGIHTHQIINEHEAAIVRELVDRLLAGESLNELYRDMNARGEPAPGYAQWMKLPEELRAQRKTKGRQPPTQRWAKSTVRTLVIRDANIAVRRYRKRDNGGTEMAGDWPPIIERAKHDRIVALLASPDRRSHSGAAPRRAETPAHQRHRQVRGVRREAAGGPPHRAGRPHLSSTRAKGAAAPAASRHTSTTSSPELRSGGWPNPMRWTGCWATTSRRVRLAERCDELPRRLDDAADSYADAKITARQLERITARLTPDLEAARRERDAAVRSLDIEALRPLAGPEAAARWESLSVAARRAVLETLGVEVVLLPRAKHGPGFEPETVRIEWKRNGCR